MKRDTRRACLAAAAALTLTLAGCSLELVPLNGTDAETPTETEQTTTVEVDVPDDSTTTSTTNSTQDSGSTEQKDTLGAERATDADAEPEMMLYTEEAAEGFVGMGYTAPVEFNTEEYDTLEESGFVMVETKPLSTVSADVDTASYANLRRMLMDGWRTPVSDEARRLVDEELDDTDPEVIDEYEREYGVPYIDVIREDKRVIPTGAVRIEEMLNYFDYDYEVPRAGETDAFRITAKIAPCPWNAENDVVALGFASAPESEQVREAGANLVFLIDVSGSMDAADKLELLKNSFSELTRTLTENDVVSIVTYSGEEEVVLEGCPGNDERTIMNAIRSLEASGSTNGEAGLKMAYEVAERNRIDGGVNRIVMASDGDLNVGMSSESDLHDFVDQKRATGIYLSVLGFGTGNYKDNKMETLADHGNGSYHYIDCEAEARRVFADRLTANLVPFADDTKLQVEFNPANIKAYRLIGYENRAMADEDFLDDEKDAGEVGPGAQFTVLYEVVPVGARTDVEVPTLKYGRKTGTAATSGAAAATADATGETSAASQATTSSVTTTAAEPAVSSGVADTAGATEYADEYLTATLRYKDAANAGTVVTQDKVLRLSDRTTTPDRDFDFCCAVTEFGMLLRDSEHKGTSSLDEVRRLVGTTDDALRQEFLELVDKAQDN